jgi:hypothetical protein
MLDKVDFYLDYARRHYPGRLVYIGECVLCGKLSIRGYDIKKPEGYTLSRIHPNECSVCVEMQRGNPEIFEWVLSVVATAAIKQRNE